jgi:radical SAM superfamily enzyme
MILKTIIPICLQVAGIHNSFNKHQYPVNVKCIVSYQGTNNTYHPIDLLLKKFH